MFEKIGVSALKEVNVFYEGDIYDLACLLLKLHDAKDKTTTSRSYHTVHGLASAYSYLAQMNQDKILKIFEQYDLPLGATVMHDEELHRTK